MGSVLDKIRILEWGQWQTAPTCTQMLGDLGAEVIKIEKPLTGDPERGLSAIQGRQILFPRKAVGVGYYVLNRNKKSITIDVTKPRGREVVCRLVRNCDVFVQNFRKGVAKRRGLDYASLSPYNPRLIYASVTGYGTEGPDSEQIAFDYSGLARSGLLAPGGEASEVSLSGMGIVDQVTGLSLAYGILGALFARERTGAGDEVEVSLLGSAMCLAHSGISVSLTIGENLPVRHRKKMKNPLYNHYRCGNGKWLAFSALNSTAAWPDFCKALGAPELENNPDFASAEKRSEHAEALIAILDKALAARPRDEWIAVFSRFSTIPFSPVNSPTDLAHDPQVAANNYIVEYEAGGLGPVKAVGCPVRFAKNPAGLQRVPPELGQHTEEVLVDVGGYSWEEIGQLKEAGII